MRHPHTLEQALDLLRASGKAENRAGMARFGIATDKALGVSMPDIRAAGKAIVPDHDLAEALWATGVHEARILAGLVDRPQWVTPAQMDRWAGEFDSWDVCDQVCGNLFDRTPHARDKIVQWSGDRRAFVKRAGFATLAWRAVHDKKAEDSEFLPCLDLIRREAGDERNFVKKAVNWALRQIGKRSAGLHAPSLALARELAESADRTARWIGRDAAKELDSDRVRAKLGL
ncbi:MAG: DNA alkylation repair protein [Pseudomonadota bacterium]|nr:DNA alkylation repair protein [Pseudomonadota bacterium]